MTQAPEAPDAALAAARTALERHEWPKAYALLTTADSQGELDATGLRLLASAAWWSGKFSEAIDYRERAYAVAIKANEHEAAVAAALDLAVANLQRMSIGVAGAWANRAERLLDGQPENPGHGWLAAVRSFLAHLAGKSDQALAQASLALDIGVRFGQGRPDGVRDGIEGGGLDLARGSGRGPGPCRRSDGGRAEWRAPSRPGRWRVLLHHRGLFGRR